MRIRFNYIRYAGHFLMGLVGSKVDCLNLIKTIKKFLKKKLKKTKITHAETDYASFLGYRVYKNFKKNRFFKGKNKGKKNKMTHCIKIKAPISEIIKRLEILGFLNRKTKKPTRNGTLLNYNIKNMINIFKNIEAEIKRYYIIVSNFKKLASSLHFILKYSCALTIAAKRRITSLKKVFKKYGKNLNIEKNILYKKLITQRHRVNYPD